MDQYTVNEGLKTNKPEFIIL